MMQGVMSIAQRLAEALREKGFNVDVESGELIELMVSRGDVRAHIALPRAGLPNVRKLLLAVGGEPGVTILECSDMSRVVDRVRRLVKTLGEHAR